MTATTDADDEAQTTTVSERKFNGTATLNVTAESKRRAKAAARQYFEDVHGSNPSKIVAEEDPHVFSDDGKTEFEVMVADHSSGSMNSSVEYEW